MSVCFWFLQFSHLLCLIMDFCLAFGLIWENKDPIIFECEFSSFLNVLKHLPLDS